jgi:hypothetical protein
MPLRSSLGIVIVPTATLMFGIAGVFTAGWLAVMLFLGRRDDLVRVAALVVVLATAIAITIQSRPLLFAAAVAMGIIGLVASRLCVTARCTSLDLPQPRA